jgi:HEAT repeat protein
MNENFDAFLEALRDEELPIPIDDFESVSDLDSTQLVHFLETWDTLSLERRHLLIALLGQQADEKFELNFDLINQAMLDDPDHDVRRIAIGNLWESEDAALIPALSVALLDTAHLPVQIAAAEALGRFVLLGQLGKLPEGALASIEEQLLDSLRQDPDDALRGTIIESLGYSSGEEASEAIEAAYKSGRDSLQASAVNAMGRSCHERWTDTIMEELANPSPDIRAEAARAAGELEIRSARATLIELLDDVHDLVQRNAVWALGQIGGESALEALNRLLASTHAEEALYQAIEESLDHIAFLQGTPDFLLFDLDEEDA